jgi:hypothetical protein
MCQWEWESFENLLNNETFAITDVGPLRAPIRSFAVRRDEKLRIVLETKAEQNAQSSGPTHPPGTVRVNADTVSFSGMMGTVVAHGVQPKSHSGRISGNSAEGELRETSDIHSLEAILIHPGKAVGYVIEWLANVDDSFVWPHFSGDNTKRSKTRRLHDGVNGVEMKSSSDFGGRSRDCVRFAVDGCTIYLATCKLPEEKRLTKSGFILYEGNPSREFQKKIVDCLSFALGAYLVRLGSSSFDEDWNMVACNAVSAYAPGGRAFEAAALPPAPLGLRYQREIDPVFLVRMVDALYRDYDALRFGSLSWAYWHAVAATPHIAAVHFGAVVEALQAAYLDSNKGAVKTTLVEKDSWRTLSGKFLAAIDELSVDETARQALRNKVGDFNKPPHGIITDRLLDVLHLQLGEREKKAWKWRNDAGHGNEIDPGGYIELIRDITLLRIRFNKMLFAITAASDFYNDHFTINHAIRKLDEPVP